MYILQAGVIYVNEHPHQFKVPQANKLYDIATDTQKTGQNKANLGQGIAKLKVF